MQHTESSIKIFYTKEYSRFRMINGNRQLNERKVKKIIEDIEDGTDVLKYCPIIVVEKAGVLEIVDGQHRFFVARKLGSHVWYIVANEFTLHEIAKMNSNTEKWKDKDFINCYIQQGNDQYLKLRDFKESTGFPTTVCLKLLAYGTVIREGGIKSTDKERFRTGEFEVLEEQKAKVITEKVKLFADFGNHKSGPFVEAICKILRSGIVSVEDICKKWLLDPKQLEHQVNAKDYLTNLETIYNKNAKIRKVIYE